MTVVIPARNAAADIDATVRSVLAQPAGAVAMEVLVVDDGSTDGTAEAARRAGARVLELPPDGSGGNPARARNRGAAEATGDPIVFLDADCTPAEGWLERLLAAHADGAVVVGGSLDLPRGLSPSARCDYYCGWYHVHPGRPAGFVPNHPPANLSVRRDAFLATSGFTERFPVAYAHEELEWQGELARKGHRIRFEPRAVVFHRNRPGFLHLLRRNYRWAYSAIESKARTGTARMGWLYRHPALLVVLSGPLALAQAVYITACWMRAGVMEPLLLSPVILAARLAYGAGMARGGLRWLRAPGRGSPDHRPRWE